MPTALERVQLAWKLGEPLALHREIEKLAAEGQSRQSLEDALEALLLTVRQADAGDEAEEIINGVWDRLTDWCHVKCLIEVKATKETSQEMNSLVNGAVTAVPHVNPTK